MQTVIVVFIVLLAAGYLIKTHWPMFRKNNKTGTTAPPACHCGGCSGCGGAKKQ